MSKTIKYNILLLLVLILTLLIFIVWTNHKFSGVPIYDRFGITVKDLQARHINLKKDYPKEEWQYLSYFNNYSDEDFIEKYKKHNDVDKILKLSGVDINVYYFNDKNNCRENKEIYYKNSDIVLIGDSYLWGVSINTPFDITGNLRNKFPNKRILNLGTPGTGPVDQLSILKNLTKNNYFKNIVWFFYEGNDFQETDINKTNSRINCQWGYKNLNDNIILINNPYKLNKVTNLKIFLSENLRGLSSFFKQFKSYKNKYEINKIHYNQILSEAKKYLDKKNVQNRIIYYIPSYSYHSYKKNSKHPQLKKILSLRNEVKDIAIKNGFKFVDGNIYLDKVKDRLQLYHYGYPTHFNSLGYKIVADQLAEEF